MSEFQTVELKGNEYKLSSLDLNDFVELEEKFPGEDINKLLASFRGTRYMLYLALRKNHSGLKVEDVGRMIDLGNLEKIQEILQKLGGEQTQNPPAKKGERGKK